MQVQNNNSDQNKDSDNSSSNPTNQSDNPPVNNTQPPAQNDKPEAPGNSADEQKVTFTPAPAPAEPPKPEPAPTTPTSPAPNEPASTPPTPAPEKPVADTPPTPPTSPSPSVPPKPDAAPTTPTPSTTPTEPPKKTEFPFEPIQTESSAKIDVETKMDTPLEDGDDEKVKPEETTTTEPVKPPVNVSNYSENSDNNIPHSSTDNPAMPPVKQSSNSSKAAVTVVSVAVAFIALGFFGGFFGFKYSPKLAKLFSATADTDQSSQTTSDVSQPQSSSATPSEVSSWPIYSNTGYLYSVKYPDTWYSKNANDPTAADVIFSSADPSSDSSGQEVEIASQALSGQALRDWIEANNTVSASTAESLSTVTVASQEAFQQNNTSPIKSVVTYLAVGDNVVTLTYSGPTDTFDSGKALYDKMLNSIKLIQ